MKKSNWFRMLILWGFLLGILDGNIALWSDDPTVPPVVFPNKAAMLPKADCQRLESGIFMNEAGELRDLLEDYLS